MGYRSGSYYNIPEAIFYLLNGVYRGWTGRILPVGLQGLGFRVLARRLTPGVQGLGG